MKKNIDGPRLHDLCLAAVRRPNLFQRLLFCRSRKTSQAVIRQGLHVDARRAPQRVLRAHVAQTLPLGPVYGLLVTEESMLRPGRDREDGPNEPWRKA